MALSFRRAGRHAQPPFRASFRCVCRMASRWTSEDLKCRVMLFAVPCAKDFRFAKALFAKGEVLHPVLLRVDNQTYFPLSAHDAETLEFTLGKNLF